MAENKLRDYIVVFIIGEYRIGISLHHIQRIIRAVEITPLPEAPSIVIGIINMGNEIIPIVNFRQRLGLEDKELQTSDQITIVRSASLVFGFVSDEIKGLQTIDESNIKKPGDIIPGSNKLVEGIAVVDNELIFIHNVDKFLSLSEEKTISESISNINKRK